MKRLTTVSMLLCFFCTAFSQNAEEEKIKNVVRVETEYYFNRNLEAWRSTWKQDAKASRTFIASYGYQTDDKWDSAVARTEAYFKQSPAPRKMDISHSNYDLIQRGEMAWVAYDQVLAGPGIDTATNYGLSREYRVLVKKGDEWKIASQITTYPESYNANHPKTIEDNLNATGYSFIKLKKLNEAIEVFKLNVKLYPSSWYTYDSLGEAYALAGDKKNAIENYEKSVKLNPKSEGGLQALKKLREK